LYETAAVSAIATAHPIKPWKSLEIFLSGFSSPGEGGVRVAKWKAEKLRIAQEKWWEGVGVRDD